MLVHFLGFLYGLMVQWDGTDTLDSGTYMYIVHVTVEPHLLDTPDMQTSTIMWTLRSIQNAISIDLQNQNP